MSDDLRFFAPGRVNLIGDHTDHCGGVALPCAIDRGITILGRVDESIDLVSSLDDSRCEIALPAVVDPSRTPSWSRYVAAVASLVRPDHGIVGRIDSDLPVASGLSSSAALEVATALALGADDAPLDLARLCQRAEHLATGTPTGLLDQIACTHGVEGAALLVDFTTLDIETVAVPDGLDLVVVHSNEERTVETSAYAERVAACEAAAAIVGSLPSASIADIAAIDDPLLRRRARHVVSECERVHAAVDALRDEDAATFGALMVESHRSLRDDFEVSTPTLDALVDRLRVLPGVYGARLTGAGFGGCVVALCASGAIDDPTTFSGRGWIVRPAAGASADR